MKKANELFIKNLRNLRNQKDIVPTKMKYSDGVPAKAITIGEVNESYIVDNYLDIYGYYELPIQSYRHTPTLNALKEIYWIYKLQSNKLDDLRGLGILHWWEDFAISPGKLITKDLVDRFKGTIGKAYGYTVKRHNLYNNLIVNILANPYARDLILSLWQEGDMEFQRRMGGLLPCAYSFKVNLKEEEHYNVMTFTLKQRSNDYLTANSINKTQYFGVALDIVEMLNNNILTDDAIRARFNNKPVRLHRFNHNIDDLHIYDRHLDLLDKYIDEITPFEEPAFIKYKDAPQVTFYNKFNIIKPNTMDKTPLEFATL